MNLITNERKKNSVLGQELKNEELEKIVHDFRLEVSFLRDGVKLFLSHHKLKLKLSCEERCYRESEILSRKISLPCQFDQSFSWKNTENKGKNKHLFIQRKIVIEY